jgi:hypothetical protein
MQKKHAERLTCSLKSEGPSGFINKGLTMRTRDAKVASREMIAIAPTSLLAIASFAGAVEP